MAWTAGPFEHGRNARDINVRGLFRTLRVDICRCRRKDEVRMALFQLLAIFLQRTRIARQVVRAVKLHRINEDTDHHDICTGFRFVDQFHMAVMQVTHGRDQCDTFTFLSCTANMLAKQRQGFND